MKVTLDLPGPYLSREVNGKCEVISGPGWELWGDLAQQVYDEIRRPQL